MGALRRFLIDSLGYTRREKRATFILLVIIACVLVVRYTVPSKMIDIREIPVVITETVVPQDTFRKKERAITLPAKTISYPIRHQSLDLNSCDSMMLVTLPGIGPVLSARIIKYRNLLGGYVSVNQLREVYGLPEETFNLIRPMVFADSLSVTKINVNEAEFRDLIRHPYFDRGGVNAILKFRQIHGKLSGFEEIRENKLLSGETFSKIRPYLEF